MSAVKCAPSLAKLRFLPGFEDPSTVWSKCRDVQEGWDRDGTKRSDEDKYIKLVEEFYKKAVVDSIWSINVLEDTLPEGARKSMYEEVLSKAFDEDIEVGYNEPSVSQLIQHLKAFKFLCGKQGSKSLPDLTEDMIKEAHSIMMHGLTNEQGSSVNAGSYRTISVCAGNGHVYPSHTCIPTNMEKIVKKYNEKWSSPHDAFDLASWLYFNVVSLHPFVDGNGRISRLLWSYSLLRDGLPFPALLSSGHRKSQKHLVMCIQRDCDRLLYDDNPHITTLTVFSVLQAWKEFLEHCKLTSNSLGTSIASSLQFYFTS